MTRSTIAAVTSGKARHPAREPTVEHGQARLGERGPTDFMFRQPRLVVTLPRAQDIAAAHELDARGVGEQDLGRDHAVEHQQSEVLRAPR
jgi:hypothetical protein